MADHDAPILRGEMLEIVRRLDDRISSLAEEMRDMRADMRQMRTWIFGLYGFILAVAGTSLTFAKVM